MILSPRLRRTLEIVYGIEGVAGARVWQWAGHVAVGVRPSPLVGASDLLRRVEAAVTGLREPAETWVFGVLDLNEPSPAPPAGEPKGPAPRSKPTGHGRRDAG